MMRLIRMMKIRYWFLLLLTTFSSVLSQAQVTGGQSAMSFLSLPNAPHITALGGMNVAHPVTDISFAFQNPSLMRSGMHNQLALNYNSYYSDIKIMNLNYGYHAPKINTSFLFGIQYLDYGNFTQTDNIGNTLGDFKATDYVISIGASRAYQEHWRYGATLKWAKSNLFDKQASALLMDVGISYTDTTNLITLGAVAKNMGFFTQKYNPNQTAEPLPFDLQIGISKRFAHMPLRLMATAHHLYQWDIRYNNPNDIQSSVLFGSSDTTADNNSYFVDKLFRHLTMAAELSLSKRLSVTVAYNYLRRNELKIKDRPAMAGVSMGVDVYLNKFQIHFVRSFYHVAGAYNEIGINMAMNKLFDLGSLGDKSNWNADYGD